jgi:hypothetical protein
MQVKCEGDDMCVMKRKRIDAEYSLNTKKHSEKVTEQMNDAITNNKGEIEEWVK